MVRLQTRMPGLSNSPRMRSAPQRGLRPAISRMSAARSVGGRPDRRERRRQNARNPARCQRRMVADWMSRVASRQAGATRAARTIVKRCQGVHRTRPATFRSAAMSCCRRSAFSATSSARRVRSTASPKTNRRRSITCRVLHRRRAGGICSQDGDEGGGPATEPRLFVLRLKRELDARLAEVEAAIARSDRDRARAGQVDRRALPAAWRRRRSWISMRGFIWA